MPNQTDYDKVNSHMMAPLSILFHAKMPDEIADGYVEELSRFTADTLREAFKKLRREEKRMPSLATVIEACKESKPTQAVKRNPDQPRFHCAGHAEQMHPISALKILSSTSGKLALSLGVARELLLKYETDGTMEFEESFVRKLKRDLDAATQDVTKVDLETDIGKALSSLFGGFMEREKRLFAEYSSKLETTMIAA